jgi:hypothetical protein
MLETQMKWYERFLKKISDFVPLSETQATAIALARLNPDHIELENVRSALGISYSAARRVCDTAVRRGVFLPRTAIMCPDDSVARVLNDSDSIPETVQCVSEGELQTLPTESLERREFYVLNEH